MKKQNDEAKAMNEALKDIAKEVSANDLLNDFKSKVSANKDKISSLYKDEIYKDLSKEEKKSLRMKIRRKRNALLKGIIALHKEGKKDELKEEVSTFISFYKAFYKVNDLSATSLSANNKDEDTSLMINEALSIIKEMKVKV